MTWVIAETSFMCFSFSYEDLFIAEFYVKRKQYCCINKGKKSFQNIQYKKSYL